MATLIVNAGNDTLVAESYAHAYRRALPFLYAHPRATVAIFDTKKSSHHATKTISMDRDGRFIIADYTKNLHTVYYIYYPNTGKLVKRE